MVDSSYDGVAEHHTLLERALMDERAFTLANDADLASGASLSLALENPAGSDMNLLVFYGEVSHEGEVNVVVWDDVSSISGGTTPHHANNHIGSSQTPSANAYTDLSFTGNNEHQEQVYIGNGSETIFDGYKVVIPPGEYIVVEVTDQSGGNDEVGIRLSYAEV